MKLRTIKKRKGELGDAYKHSFVAETWRLNYGENADALFLDYVLIAGLQRSRGNFLNPIGHYASGGMRPPGQAGRASDCCDQRLPQPRSEAGPFATNL